MVAIQLRRPTPIVNLAANRHRAHRRKRAMSRLVPVCLRCRGRGLNPACAGHPLAGGVIYHGCESCGGADLWVPSAAVPFRNIA